MMSDDLNARVAVLEAKVAAMQGDHAETVKLLKELSTDIHAIKETIATGKGVWWAVGFVLFVLAGIAGGAGALTHKLIGGQ